MQGMKLKKNKCRWELFPNKSWYRLDSISFIQVDTRILLGSSTYYWANFFPWVDFFLFFLFLLSYSPTHQLTVWYGIIFVILMGKFLIFYVVCVRNNYYYIVLIKKTKVIWQCLHVSDTLDYVWKRPIQEVFKLSSMIIYSYAKSSVSMWRFRSQLILRTSRKKFNPLFLFHFFFLFHMKKIK